MNQRISTTINSIVLFCTALFSLVFYRNFGLYSYPLNLFFTAALSVGFGSLLQYALLSYVRLPILRRYFGISEDYEGTWFGTLHLGGSEELVLAEIRFRSATNALELYGQGFNTLAEQKSYYRSSIFEYVRTQERAVFVLDYLPTDISSSGYLFGILSFSSWSPGERSDHARGVVYDSANSVSGKISLTRVSRKEILEATGQSSINGRESARDFILHMTGSGKKSA